MYDFILRNGFLILMLMAAVAVVVAGFSNDD